jgi:MFS family permease
VHADRKNVLLLSCSQALLTTSNVVLISINGLAGHALATSKALATLPVTCFVVGGALSTMPASLLMHRIGRVRGFTLGALVGIASALLCAAAVYLHDFWLLCAGNLVFGGYNASAQYYRFAAADAASPEFKNKAISLVMAGGIAGGVLGPESSKLTKDALSVPFLGSYLSLIVFALLALVLVQGMRIPPLTAAEKATVSRPLGVIVRQPIFLVAVLGAVVAFTVMNLLMTATPLAMQMCHHSFNDSASVIEWHVIGMYAPAFVTGSLIQRFGVLNLMLAGAALMLGCVGIALSGISVAHFWFALVLLGVGWSFLYIGGTTLLTESYITPSERAKTQGLNDFVMFSLMGLSSLSAGILVTSSGWNVVNYASLPLIALAIAGILWLKLSRNKGGPQGQLSESVTGA